MDAPHGTVADEGITAAELRLAARNHGLPLEALRYDITPAGLHYLLIHYDIPPVDAAVFRLEVAGAVRTPLSLTLEQLRERPPPHHGFPVRLVVPGWYGMTNVKWLARIALLEQPFEGFQNAVAYRMY